MHKCGEIIKLLKKKMFLHLKNDYYDKHLFVSKNLVKAAGEETLEYLDKWILGVIYMIL